LATSDLGITDQDGNVELVFQHYDGQLRWMQRETQSAWSGGGVSIANDLRNNTPLALVAHAVDEVNYASTLFLIITIC
jgi:hypothetical protein